MYQKGSTVEFSKKNIKKKSTPDIIRNRRCLRLTSTKKNIGKSLRLTFPKRVSERNLRPISSKLEDVCAQLQLEKVLERVYV